MRRSVGSFFLLEHKREGAFDEGRIAVNDAVAVEDALLLHARFALVEPGAVNFGIEIPEQRRMNDTVRLPAAEPL